MQVLLNEFSLALQMVTKVEAREATWDEVLEVMSYYQSAPAVFRNSTSSEALVISSVYL